MRVFVLSLLALLAAGSLVDAGGPRRRCCNDRFIEVPVAVPVAVATPVIATTFLPVQVPTYSVRYEPSIFQQTQDAVYQQVTTQQQYAQQGLMERYQQAMPYAEAGMHGQSSFRGGSLGGSSLGGSSLARSQAALNQLMQINPQELTAELGELKAKLQYYESLAKCLESLRQVGTPPTSGSMSAAGHSIGVNGSGSPKALESAALVLFKTKCASCHDASQAAANGKGHVWLEGGSFAKLTEMDRRKIMTKTYKGEMPPPNNKFNIAPLTDHEVGTIMGWLSD